MLSPPDQAYKTDSQSATSPSSSSPSSPSNPPHNNNNNNSRTSHESARSSSSSDDNPEPITITRPPAAYTNSPYVFDRNPPLAMPGPLEELTPPPSPSPPGAGRSAASPAKLRKGHHKPAASLNVDFAPLLQRATSVIAPKRSSVTSSPAREAAVAAPASESLSSGSPNRRSKAFGEFFQWQGSSAPVSFGILPTGSSSPRKEQGPTGSPFGPVRRESRPDSVGVSPSGSSSPIRPGHVRRESTLSAAASFFGLGGQRSTAASSPVRRSARSRTRLDDEIMRLDFENEMFPEESLGGKGEKAFDELLANAEKLFNRIRSAYAKKCDALNEMDDLRRADKEALEEQKLRAEHLKEQVEGMATRMSEKDAEVESLRDELEERDRRARTIRVLPPTTTDERPQSQESGQATRIWSAAGEDVFEIGRDEESDAESESERNSIFDRPSRPVSSSTAPTEEDRRRRSTQLHQQRQSMAWSDAAPFLPPDHGLQAENKDLKQRVRELEETLQSCLGLVDA